MAPIFGNIDLNCPNFTILFIFTLVVYTGIEENARYVALISSFKSFFVVWWFELSPFLPSDLKCELEHVLHRLLYRFNCCFGTRVDSEVLVFSFGF